MKKFNPFQIRWKEVLTKGNKPYLHRWTFLFFNYSIRIHHWIDSDVGPHLHDHACNFISILLWGGYENQTMNGNISLKAPSIWYSNAEARHRLEIAPGGAWAILLCGRPYRKWGFWVNNHLWRPLRYFHKYAS